MGDYFTLLEHRGRRDDFKIAYLGDVSIYHVRLDSGLVMQVQLTNLARIAEPPLTWDQEVWLSWQPGSGMVFPA